MRLAVDVDDDRARVVCEALRTVASGRRQVAERGAAELQADVAAGLVADAGPMAVRIVEILGEASVLEEFAAALEEGARPRPAGPSEEQLAAVEAAGRRPPLPDDLPAALLEAALNPEGDGGEEHEAVS